jgi:hypothetical protein
MVRFHFLEMFFRLAELKVDRRGVLNSYPKALSYILNVKAFFLN